MKVLITDANILIDLLKTETEDIFFRLEYEIYTTLAVIIECNDKQQVKLNRFIKSRKLFIYNFNPDDDGQIEMLIKENRGLSPADCSILYLVRKIEATLLTGDKKLRKTAEEQNLDVRGIFWVFDEMLKQKLMKKSDYKIKLKNLKEVNKRLPEGEFKTRI